MDSESLFNHAEDCLPILIQQWGKIKGNKDQVMGKNNEAKNADRNLGQEKQTKNTQ